MNIMNTTIKNLMFDLGAGHEIFDDESNRVISKAEAIVIICIMTPHQ